MKKETREGLEQEVDSYSLGYKHGKVDGIKEGFEQGSNEGHRQGVALGFKQAVKQERYRANAYQWTRFLFYIFVGTFASHLLWALISVLLG